MVDEANKRGYGKKRAVFLADGYDHIWTFQQKYFPDAALTVEPEDQLTIAAAIRRLMLEPKLRADLISRGKARGPRFSRQAQAKATAQVYRQFFGIG